MNRFRMILRYGLDPLNALDENLRQLRHFAEESTIDEVMFLVRPEERSAGHPVIEQTGQWMDAMLQAKAMLSEIGVDVSVNPWTTTYHTGRGRVLQPGQDFRLMVGETGVDNGMTACPLDEKWQDYLVEYFSWIAQELDPVALWVEDDWRLHNHGGSMGYGGCFCDACLERFSAMVGKSAAREDIVLRVSQPGEPHPWRAKWIEFAAQSLTEPAEKLAAALKTVRPEMRLGFMTSIPDVQSIEGRDWNGFMDIWSQGGDRYLIRPHMPPYTEEPPITTTPCYSRQTIAELDKSADIYPELENSPRCGQYSGSHNYTAWQIINAVGYGSRGITINHFDNMGMNTYYDRGMGKYLGRLRPTLDALMPLKIDDRKALGVKILFSPQVAAHKRTGTPGSGGVKMYTGEDLSQFKSGEGSLNDLQADSVAWSKVFYILGISHSFTRSIDDSDDSIYAVSDQTLWCYDDDQIRRLLSKKLILDLPSIEILVERGFGDLIGVVSAERVKLDDTGYSLEEVLPEFLGELEGGVAARMCAQRCSDPIGRLTYVPEAQILSQLKKADLEIFSPASALYRNELGGSIHSSCYALGGGQFYMAYFNVVRQQYWTKLLFDMGGAETDQVIACGHPLHVHACNIEGGIFCAATNVIYDTTDSFRFKISAKAVEGRQCRMLNSNVEWELIKPEISIDGGIASIEFNLALAPLQSAFITFAM